MTTVVDRCDAAPSFRTASKLRTPVRRRRRHERLPTLDEAQRDLATRYLPLARSLAYRLKVLFPFWGDEFESAACLALVEAAQAFNPERPVKFSTFARIRIAGALRDVSRSMILPGFDKHDRGPDLVSLTPFSEEFGEVLGASAEPGVGAEVDDIDAVEAWLRKLPKRHAEVCRLYYVHGKTQSEISEVIGCSQAEVTRLHKRAIDLLSDPYQAKNSPSAAGWSRFGRPIDLEQPPRKLRNRAIAR